MPKITKEESKRRYHAYTQSEKEGVYSPFIFFLAFSKALSTDSA